MPGVSDASVTVDECLQCDNWHEAVKALPNDVSEDDWAAAMKAPNGAPFRYGFSKTLWG